MHLISVNYAQGNQQAPLPHVKTITISGNFFEMGQSYARQLNHQLKDQYRLFKRNILPKQATPEQIKQFHLLTNQIIATAKSRYTKELIQFLQGESSFAYEKNLGLTLNDFIYLDQIILISSLAVTFNSQPKKSFSTLPPVSMSNCSFLGYKQKGVIIGRNFDWAKEFISSFTQYPLIVTLKANDKQRYPHAVTLVGNPGLISNNTFINDQGLFAGINNARSAVGDYKVWERPSYFAQLFTNFFKFNDFKQLKKWIRNTSTDYGYIINIAGPHSSDLISAEASPFTETKSTFKIRFRHSNSNNTLDPSYDRHTYFIASTNSFRLTDWEKWLGHLPAQQTQNYSLDRYEHLINLFQNSHLGKKININQMQRIFELPLEKRGATESLCSTHTRYSDNPDATLHTIVFNTRTKRLSVRFQHNCEKSAHWTSWKTIKIKT